jgi:hypothetical protein
VDFCRKILLIDALAFFDPSDRRRVRCGRCDSWSSQRGDLDVERFKEHRKGKKCKAGKPTQKTLHSFRLAPPVVQERVRSACPGLGAVHSELIPQYLERTAMLSGGAPPRWKLEAAALKKRQRTGRGQMSSKALRRTILSEERAQALWFNNHSTLTVSSSQCRKLVYHPAESGPRPCFSCMSLLQLKTFRNQLRRGTPRGKNWKFAPKAYRIAPVLAKSYARHMDVEELLVSSAL